MVRLALLLSIVVFAAGLRLSGSGAGLPQSKDPDSVIVTQAQRMERGLPVTDLYPYFLAGILQALPGELAPPVRPEASPAEIRAAASRAQRWGRLLVGLLSLLAIPGVYLLARRRMSAGWALFAAALMATSLLHEVLSHQARPHGALLSFFVWTLWFAEGLARRPSLWMILGASASSGLALATLHSGAALGPPLALAAFLALRSEEWGPAGKWGGVARLCLLAIGPLLALWWSYPFLFSGRELWAGREFGAHPLNGDGFARTARALLTYDPTLLLLGLPPLVWRWFRRKDGVLAAFALPYFLALGLYYNTFPRFCLPFIPLLAVAGAWGASRVAAALGGRSRRVAVALAAVILAFPAATAVRFAWVWSRPRTTDLAADWIEEHLDPHQDRLAVSPLFDLPLLQTRKSMGHTPRYVRSPWCSYLLGQGVEGPWQLWSLYQKPAQREAIDRMDGARVRALLHRLRVTHALVIVPPREGTASRDGMRELIRAEGGRLLARFESYDSGVLSGTSGRAGSGQFGDEVIRIAWLAGGLGPGFELYALPRGR